MAEAEQIHDNPQTILQGLLMKLMFWSSCPFWKYSGFLSPIEQADAQQKVNLTSQTLKPACWPLYDITVVAFDTKYFCEIAEASISLKDAIQSHPAAGKSSSNSISPRFVVRLILSEHLSTEHGSVARQRSSKPASLPDKCVSWVERCRATAMAEAEVWNARKMHRGLNCAAAKG